MRKDYATVPAGVETQSEAAFVERYWSGEWTDRHPDPESVAKREEFRILKPYLERLPAGSRILDGGCGLGDWTVFLSRMGFDVVGLDLSTSTIDRLRELYPAQTFMRADIRTTGFASDSFALYFSWGAFEHFESGIGDCVAEAHRLLRPDGLLFVSVPHQNWRHVFRDSRPLYKWDETYDRRNGYRGRQRFYQWRFTRSEFQRELELRGFKVVRVVPISKDTGAGRCVQHAMPFLSRSGTVFAAARKGLAAVLPAGYISHMLLAVARKVG